MNERSSPDSVQAAMQECVDIATRYYDCGGDFIAEKIRDRILSLQPATPAGGEAQENEHPNVASGLFAREPESDTRSSAGIETARIVTVKVPDGYDSVWDFLNDCGLESVPDATQSLPKWRHLKRGSVVTEIGRGRAQCATGPINEMDEVVIYEHDGRKWVRKVDEFEDGRFEAVSMGEHRS